MTICVNYGSVLPLLQPSVVKTLFQQFITLTKCVSQKQKKFTGPPIEAT